MWTEQIVKVLRHLIQDEEISFGEAAAAINYEFGTSLSRNACISKAKREGIVTPPERINSAKGTRKPRQKGLTGAAADNAVRSIIAKRIEYPPVVDDDIPLAQRKTIFELTSETCRWPVGEPGAADFFFCGGEAVNNGPYCAGHHARAHEPYRGKPNLFVKWKRAA